MKKVFIILCTVITLVGCGSKKNDNTLVQQIDEQRLEQEASDYAFNEFVVKYKLLQRAYLVSKEEGLTQKDFRRCFGAKLFEINMENYDLEKAFVTNSDEFLDAMTTKYKSQYKMLVLEDAYEHNMKVINAIDQIDPNTNPSQKVTLYISK